MDKEIKRRIELCDKARNPDWDQVVLAARHLGETEKALIRLHPPGLIRALWDHFEATRDKCGCQSPSHERKDCSVHLIERILLDEESL